MMINKITKLFLIIPILFTNISLFAQPRITGSVQLNRERGMFFCEFELSNIPEISRYRILLNHGMNIKYIKDSEGNSYNYGGYYEGKMNGEAIEYYLTDDSKDTIALPGQLKISYSGAYPVYDSEKNTFDFKGYVAINEKTIRATEQAKWYPVLYDMDEDALIDSYTYDIKITIEDGSSIFLNGSSPVNKQTARFKSNKAVPLFLFAGDFNFIKAENDYIINANVSEEIAAKIITNIGKIKEVYKNMMEEEFSDNIYLINHSPVKELGPNENWGFNVYPAFAFAGLDFNNLLNNEGRFHQGILHFFSHEMAHNYFGMKARSGTLQWFWLESIAEYMALLALDDLSNERHIKWEVEKKMEYARDGEFVPLSAVKEVNEIDEIYRYNMGPLILKVFEGEFGKDKMVIVLRSLYKQLMADGMLTLSSFKRAALASGVSDDDYAEFSDTYLKSENFEKSVFEYIKQGMISGN